MDSVGMASKSGRQVVPPLVVFQTPPLAVPTYTMLGSPGTPSTSVARPIMLAGPMLRNASRESTVVSTAGRGAGWAPSEARDVGSNGAAVSATPAATSVAIRMGT
jgi:hypothetical protein